MSRRQAITMSRQEIVAFLAEQRVVICATQGPRGWPHLMPLWYVPREDVIWTWTYAKSQKVRNLERDPRATLQVEDGERYEQLRGVMIEAETAVHRAPDVVERIGAEILRRYGGDSGPDFAEAVRAQAAKRVVLEFRPQRVASWDHRKLHGRY